MCEQEISPQGEAKHLSTSTKHSILFDVRLLLLKIPHVTSLCDTSLNSSTPQLHRLSEPSIVAVVTHHSAPSLKPFIVAVPFRAEIPTASFDTNL